MRVSHLIFVFRKFFPKTTETWRNWSDRKLFYSNPYLKSEQTVPNEGADPWIIYLVEQMLARFLRRISQTILVCNFQKLDILVPIEQFYVCRYTKRDTFFKISVILKVTKF